MTWVPLLVAWLVLGLLMSSTIRPGDLLQHAAAWAAAGASLSIWWLIVWAVI